MSREWFHKMRKGEEKEEQKVRVGIFFSFFNFDIFMSVWFYIAGFIAIFLIFEVNYIARVNRWLLKLLIVRECCQNNAEKNN